MTIAVVAAALIKVLEISHSYYWMACPFVICIHLLGYAMTTGGFASSLELHVLMLTSVNCL